MKTPTGDYQTFIDDLTYASYRNNRLNFPETLPEQWAKIYPRNSEAMELRFQQECQRYLGKYGDTARCWLEAMNHRRTPCQP